MLKTAGFKLPAKVHIHGFLTVGGEKMSKSKGTFIQAATYLKHLNPAYLRYYYASKLTRRVDDLDLNPEEFVTKVNSDLVGKVVNLASRTAKFVEGQELIPNDSDPLIETIASIGEDNVADAYERCDFAEAMRQIMLCADKANQYIDREEPWKLKKSGNERRLLKVCTVALNAFRKIAIYLAPVLPKLAEQADRLLPEVVPEGTTYWDRALYPLGKARVSKFETMLTRVEPAQVHAMIEETRESASAGLSANAAADASTSLAPRPSPLATADSPEPLAAEPLAPECTIDDFTKIDLRVARILTAEEVPDARKLLKLTLSLGGDTSKTVFAGIKKAYPEPAKLVGRLVICVANLAPRQMKFGLSEAMVAAAGSGGDEVFLLSPDSGAKPGQRVH